MAKSALQVFIVTRDTACGECGAELETGSWITLKEEAGALCLTCADLDHLLFLPSGNAALTRRATKHASLSAVVLKWSSARKRYERQGILVTTEALERAEQECLADHDARARRQERAAARRAELDEAYVKQFAQEVRRLYPGCPLDREIAIAEHACRKYSGRVGRSAAAKVFDENAIAFAVVAHIRHTRTAYDQLLARGYDRSEARAEVQWDVQRVLAAWEQPIQTGPE
ncbi:MAG: DUF2293 domain-containing protein [Phycisphaerales bacterium]|nr:DUF2293 domain-containing protein [Phycisphaerales bacterium]